MKRILFILCCLTSLGITIYLTYKTWERFAERSWYQNLIYLIAILGWCFITEKVFNKKYKWTQKFFE